MALTIEDWNVGDKVFFGSRWHIVSRVEEKGKKRSTWPTAVNERDFLAVRCGTGNYGVWQGSGKEATYRAVPTEEDFHASADDDVKPLCATCHYGRPDSTKRANRGIPLSAISDPDLKARIKRRLDNKYQSRWTVYVDAAD